MAIISQLYPVNESSKDLSISTIAFIVEKENGEFYFGLKKKLGTGTKE